MRARVDADAGGLPAIRLGIFGGMFDPPHLGHVELVRAALEAGIVDRVLVVPAGPAPGHRAPPVAPAELRLRMARAAFAEEARVAVSEIEVVRAAAGGEPWMIDTVRELVGSWPGVRPVLLVGADQLASFTKWHQWEELARLVHEVAVAGRPFEAEDDEVATTWQAVEQAGGRVRGFVMDPHPASSTFARDAAASGDRAALEQLLPADVLESAADTYAGATRS